MNHKPQIFTFDYWTILCPLGLVLAMWLVYWVEIKFGYNFNALGIYPRTFSGLKGILFSPFIHSSGIHLWHNSVPLAILVLALVYFYRNIGLTFFVLLYLGSGFLTWGIGRASYHIGMSSIVYGLFGFLIVKGFYSKQYRLIAVALIVIFLYGSLIWGIFPQVGNTSWEGHLAGLALGVVLGFCFRENSYIPEQYQWEKSAYDPQSDPFMLQFDAEGNFFELPKDDKVLLPQDEFVIVYHFTPRE